MRGHRSVRRTAALRDVCVCVFALARGRAGARARGRACVERAAARFFPLLSALQGSFRFFRLQGSFRFFPLGAFCCRKIRRSSTDARVRPRPGPARVPIRPASRPRPEAPGSLGAARPAWCGPARLVRLGTLPQGGLRGSAAARCGGKGGNGKERPALRRRRKRERERGEEREERRGERGEDKEKEGGVLP